MAKKGMYVFVGWAIFLAPSFAFALSVSNPPWLTRAWEIDSELADCMSGVYKGWPTYEEYEGRTYTEINKASEKALKELHASFDPQKQQLIIDKLTSALNAQPPNWEVVGLALRVAYYAKPEPQILQIAEEIVKAPPDVELGINLVKTAMFLLTAPREQRYYQLIFNCAYDDDYLKTQPFKIEVIASVAVDILSTVPPEDSLPLLMKLQQKYPYDPKLRVRESGGDDMPEQQIAWEIEKAIHRRNLVLNGATINLGNTRP